MSPPPQDKTDWDDEEDFTPDDEEPTQSCPYCNREILEDLIRCPYCENYLSEEDAPPSRKPWWILLGVALALYVVYRWISNP